ncbi:MAG: hydrogenase maturation nickel metallochaperone HypA [Candidatus Thiodiazotropha sp.]|nr:hydrogenase maturation nickel metallochaperone HypA [Candidatus Thiodiazotropha sp. (ex Lucina pensylvanica)]
MHEASIAQSLLCIVQQSAAKTNAEKITRIEVSIGRLNAVEPELLSSCFEFIAEGTVCEDAELVILVIPISVRCNECGEISTISSYRFRCASCTGNALSVISGRELKVERIQAR